MRKRRAFVETLIIILLLQASIQISSTISVVNASAPLSSFQGDVVQAASGSVYFVFPDYNSSHAKPPGVSYALLSDWTAIGILYGMCSNMPQNPAPDTRGTLLNTATGAPLVGSSTLVLCGGPLVDSAVHYYEANRIAPLYYQNDGGVCYWYRSDGTRLDQTALTSSQMNSGQDMFVVESFTDSSNNKVYIVYGYGWKGTFAGGKFFKFIMYPNISSYTASFYVFKWTDANGDSFVDLNEINITPIASG